MESCIHYAIFLRLAFLTKQNALELIQHVLCINNLFFSLLSGSPLYDYILAFF